MRSSLSVLARGAYCALMVCGFAAGCGGSDGDGGGRVPIGNGNSGGGAASGAGTGTSGGSGTFGNGGNGPTGGTIGGAGTSQSGGSGGGSGDECASATVHTSTATPVVLFVIDGSGSMCETYGGSTRWGALRTALLEPTNGLIFRLQSDVVFGAMIYDGTIDPGVIIGGGGLGMGSPAPMCSGMYTAMKMTGECPQLIQVAPALDNATAIDGAFPAVELGGSTPTDKAMKAAVDLMVGMISTDPEVITPPLYIILATDGQPNSICMGGTGGDGSAQKAAVIAEVDRAAAQDIKTFVISLGDNAANDPGLQVHLEEVADHGEPMNQNAHAFSPTNPMELSDTLAALIGGAIGCEISLSGMVTLGQECRGYVLREGRDLPCCQDMAGTWMCDEAPVGDPNGWRLKDERTVELVGAECINFLEASEASLEARFPCDVFSPD